ncbi:MAG TPA: hypothetical protein VKV20_10655 [Ktedonobacteraceae bacterium]|nr:hypothetical protein [Ktedonobacteraceae bacterium]
MITLFIILVLLMGFALASALWGQDSREKMHSSEWMKRAQRNRAGVF